MAAEQPPTIEQQIMSAVEAAAAEIERSGQYARHSTRVTLCRLVDKATQRYRS